MSVTVYTKDFCPYCVQAKTLLNSLDIPFEEINVTHAPEQLEALKKRTNLRTLPQIFFEETCLGGYSDIAALHQKGALLSQLR